MKTFEKLDELRRWMGILQYDKNYCGTFITYTLNFILLGIYVFFLITTLCCLAYRAQSFGNFLENIYFALLASLCLLWYCNFICQRQNYEALFIDLDKIISESMLS